MRSAEDAALKLAGELSADQAWNILDALFWAMEPMLGVLSGLEREIDAVRESTIAGGCVWDDVDAARVRERVGLLDEVSLNVSSCHDALGVAHLLLSHAKHALSRLDTTPTADTAEHPTGTDNEESEG